MNIAILLIITFLIFYTHTSHSQKNYRTTNFIIDNHSHLKLYRTGQPDFNSVHLQLINLLLIQYPTVLSHIKQKETK